MYNPSPFKQISDEEIGRLLRSHPFASIVSQSVASSYPIASHTPLILSADAKILTGHLANANPHMKILKSGSRVLAIFSGPNHFISSYHKNPENPEILPTWNYEVVHVHGHVELMSKSELREFLIEMMKMLESKYPKRVDLSEYDQAVFDKKLGMITGFRIVIEEVQPCFRLGQNRSSAIIENIVGVLRSEGSYGSKDVADEMERINGNTKIL